MASAVRATLGDYFSLQRGMETEVHPGRTICEVAGQVIGGPADLSGFISTSRRFQIGVPANLESGP